MVREKVGRMTSPGPRTRRQKRSDANEYHIDIVEDGRRSDFGNQICLEVEDGRQISLTSLDLGFVKPVFNNGPLSSVLQFVIVIFLHPRVVII